MSIARTYVIAGTFREFSNWCAENRVSQSSPLVVYVDSPEQLRGLRGPGVVCIGTYRDRKDFEELNYVMGRINRPIEPEIVYVEVPTKLPELQVPAFVQAGCGRLVNWQ